MLYASELPVRLTLQLLLHTPTMLGNGFTVFALLALCLTCGADTITVSSTAPANSHTSLQYYLCEAADQLELNTTIELSPGFHYIEQATHMNDSCRIENISDLIIRGTGEEGETSVIHCDATNGIYILGRGFVFLNITNLVIENVRIEKCGMAVPPDLPTYVNRTYGYLGPGQKAVMLFSHCTNLHLENVTIDQSFGFGIIGINVMGETKLNKVTVSNTDNSMFSNCTEIPRVVLRSDSVAPFIYNESEVSRDLSCSGSGVVFVYGDDDFTSALGETTTLTISNSNFFNNTNVLPLNHLMVAVERLNAGALTRPSPIFGGSGLGVYVGQLGYFIDVNITDSNLQNNTGDVGSMLIILFNSIRNSHFYLENCKFIKNAARIPGRGAGMFIVILIYLDRLNSFPPYPDDIFEVMKITQSDFIGNLADSSGAIYVHAYPQNVSDYRINIENTKFIKNVASFGSALQVASIESTFIPKTTHILLQDIEAYGNTYPGAQGGTSIPQNSAAFLFLEIQNVTIAGTAEIGSKFYNNSPSAVLSSGGNILLHGHVTFENNLAFNGGALSLYDNALLLLHEGSTLQFIGNHALQFGGAIYATSLVTDVSDACAIQVIGPSRIRSTNDVHLFNLNVSFASNSAGQAGNSMYVIPLYGCATLPEASFINVNPVSFSEEQEYYKALFNFSSSVDNGLEELSSVPNRICICNQTERTFDQAHCATEAFQTLQLTTIPGQSFTVYVIPIDRAPTPVTSLLYAEVVPSPGYEDAEIQLAPAQNVRQLRGLGCSPVNFNLYGQVNSSTFIKLLASPGGTIATLNVSIDSCPPGFELDSENGLLTCTCDEFITDYIGTTCNTTTYTVLRPEDAWIGLRDHPDESTEVVFVSTCPINYCNDFITEIDLTIPDPLCENGRSGILCGKCSKGYSVMFGTARCAKCSNAWIATILIYALAGILLVLLLFVLKLTVTNGTINGLILYVNIVSVNANIFFRGTSQSFHFIFVSLLNLELGFPICFYDGMTDIGKVGFQFVFPAYLLSICGAIILLSRWFSIIQKLTASSGVQVLATLIYLSFSKILRAVIDILSFATLKSAVDNHRIWLFDGNVNYLEGLHIFLFILAVLVMLITIVPYILALTLVVPIQKYTTNSRLKAMIDAYLGPYKDKWRYWFGLRLILLVVICIIYAVSGTDNPGLALLLQQLFVTAFGMIQAYIRPYKNFAIEFLDLWFLFNFIALAAGTSHVIDTTRNEEKQEILVDLLVSLAFITFVGIITYNFVRSLGKIQVVKEQMDKMYSEAKNRMADKNKFNPSVPEIQVTSADSYEMGNHHNQNVVRSGRRSPEMAHSFTPRTTEVSLEELESSPDMAQSRPKFQSFSQFREPVLDFSD